MPSGRTLLLALGLSLGLPAGASASEDGGACDPAPAPLGGITSLTSDVAAVSDALSGFNFGEILDRGDGCGSEPDSVLLLDFTQRLTGGNPLTQAEADSCLSGLWSGAKGSLRGTVDGLLGLANRAASGLPYMLIGGPLLGPMTFEAHELYVMMKDAEIREGVEPLIRSCVTSPLTCQSVVERSLQESVRKVISAAAGAVSEWARDELSAYRCMDGAARQRLACEINGMLFTEILSLVATEGVAEGLKLTVSSGAKIEQLAAKLRARSEAISGAIERAFAKEIVVTTTRGPAREALAEMLKLDSSQVAGFGKGGMHTVFHLEAPAGKPAVRFSSRNFRIPKELAGQPADEYVFKVANRAKAGSRMAARDAEMYRALKQELNATGSGIELAETHFAQDSAGNQVIIQRKIAGKTPEAYTAEVFQGAFGGKGPGRVSAGQAEDLLRQLVLGEPVEAVGADPSRVSRVLAENPDYRALIDRLRTLRKLDAESAALRTVDSKLGDGFVASRLPWMHEPAPVRIDVAGRNLRIVGEPGKTRLVIIDY